MDDRRPSPLELLMSLAATLVMVWSVLPPQDRMWIRLRAATVTRRLLDVAASREGRAGMKDELSGRDPRLRYVTAYRLGMWRDRVIAWVKP